jgi:hypothetical protein
MSKREKQEVLRRLLVGDLRRVCRHRYGPTLPDDDAGRDDLGVLLYPISLDPNMAVEKMTAEIEVIAPWMPDSEAKQLIGDLMNLPLYWRKRPAKEIGERLRLTNAERERLMAWRIAPIDVTAEQLTEQRKAKDRARKRKRSKRTRAAYLSSSLSRTKPWEAEGISRSTWERKRRARDASMSPAIFITDADRLASNAVWPAGRHDANGSDEHGTMRRATKPKECKRLSTADRLASRASSTADQLVSRDELAAISGRVRSSFVTQTPAGGSDAED